MVSIQVEYAEQTICIIIAQISAAQHSETGYTLGAKTCRFIVCKAKGQLYLPNITPPDSHALLIIPLMVLGMLCKSESGATQIRAWSRD